MIFPLIPVRLYRFCFAVTRIFNGISHARTAWESIRRMFRLSLLLVNLLTGSSCSAVHVPGKRCMALSFAIGFYSSLNRMKILYLTLFYASTIFWVLCRTGVIEDDSKNALRIQKRKTGKRTKHVICCVICMRMRD